MQQVPWDILEWAQLEFGECRVGDRRLNRRLVQVAARIAADPSASTPDQMQWWAESKGAYRLMDNDNLSFAEIVRPHCQATRSLRTEAGLSLMIHDTTELTFTSAHKPKEGLGITGSGLNQGFHLHSALRMSANSTEIFGLAGQLLYAQQKVVVPAGKKRQSALEAKSRPRASEVWPQLIAMVGAPPVGERYIHICDRGADNYEVYSQAQLLQTDWIVRASALHRKLRRISHEEPENQLAGEQINVRALLDSEQFQGSYPLEIPARPGRPPRQAVLEVRWTSAWMPRPEPCSPWAKEHCPPAVKQQIVEISELSPPRGVTPLHWVLYTSLPVSTLAEAQQVAAWYARRPVIEDYHKALKTGCHIEERQYQTGDRLARITGILSVTAIRLLRMKTVAVLAPEKPATEVAPQEWVDALYEHRTAEHPQYEQRWPKGSWTIQEFLRQLAMLGGFLGRKHDGQPGWITLWRGTNKLQLILTTRRNLKKRCG